MTNLSKEIRLAIVESVITKGTVIPADKEAIIKSTQEAVRAWMLGYLPPGFQAATATLPPNWFATESSADIYASDNPEMILNGDTRYYGSVKFEPFRRPTKGGAYSPAINYRQEKDSPHRWESVLSAQIDAAKKLRAREEAARTDLLNFLNSCRTYKQVLAKMPELENHLPAPAMPLVVVNVGPLVASLGKLGFDRSAAAEG